MRRESFLSHLRGHPLAYLTLLCVGLLVGSTLFAVTGPRPDAPRLLLIRGAQEPPALPWDAEVRYPEPGDAPDVTQVYVLTTGGGGYDAFCAPEAIVPELDGQQLIQPIAAAGGAMSLPAGRGYALCLAHGARPDAEPALLEWARAGGNSSTGAESPEGE